MSDLLKVYSVKFNNKENSWWYNFTIFDDVISIKYIETLNNTLNTNYSKNKDEFYIPTNYAEQMFEAVLKIVKLHRGDLD